MRRYSAPLFYLIGPSGSGKDTILRQMNREHANVASIARRHITRPQGAGGENHIAVSESEFRALEESEYFALKWRSHGLLYGIAREEIAPTLTGHPVIVNGSRAYLTEALELIPALIPIEVVVDPERLAARLRARGRETEEEIAQRLARNNQLSVTRAANMAVRHQIQNKTTVEAAVTQLMAIIQQEQKPISGETPF